MSGRLFKRAAGSESLLPLPAWEEKNKSRGFVDSSLYPSSYNPAEGYIVTANNDLNHLGKCDAISLCWASYRADRAADMIKSKKKCSIGDMKMIQLDKYSLQAEKFMKAVRPHLPDSKKGDILKNWDLCYDKNSAGATLFESVYRSLKYIVFGDYGMGRDVVRHLLEETPVVTDFHGNFDLILLKKKSAWFNGKSGDEIIKMAVEEGLASDIVPYGDINRMTMSHILFGGKLPRFMGFDYGPVVLEGSRATLNQGQIFRSAGKTSTFCPSYRIITDMTTDELHTNLPGGPSERRFSELYTKDIHNWATGIYKVISPAKVV
jgi:penicillin amidase